MNKRFFESDPIRILGSSIVMASVTYFGYLICLKLDPMISYFLAASVEALAALILIQTLGKWKEVIIFSFIVVFILQFSFRSEMRSLSHLRMYDPESIPTNLPKDGFEFLKLEGYRFEDLQSTLKDWEKKYPTVAKNKITWLAFYESRESYLDSQASLLLFLLFMTPTIWFFVGFVWIVREGLHSLFHFFRS
ncbi:hypothetical protein EHQ43_18210 [Leptospira bouyouniensis]|uniref:Uncharacterized protein n=1 Tax=Leptospira bouyouniensis TaxID=2484911 RepID=A0A7I0HNC9_9LEPT|nr:hypothetical protein [Leptospira bouyouniensis]TGL02292.1 hypothetical protein EHQ43_18210 [Leptospira bouyouniensis]